MRLLLVISLLATLCVLADGKAKPKPEEKSPEPYSKVYETGPLRVKLELDRTSLSLDETILLKLEVIAPEKFTATLPKLDEGVEQFRWELETSTAPELDTEGNLHTRRSLRLEPIVIYEKISVKPLNVHFKSNDGKEYDIETDEVEIKVEMPPEEFWQNLEIDQSISETPVKRLNAALPKWIPWAVGAFVAICAIAILAVLLRKRQKAAKIVPARPPQEIALDELRALVA